MDAKVRKLRQLAAKPRTPRAAQQRRSEGLPTLGTPAPAWERSDIEDALTKTRGHVGQALLVLQDPSYTPGAHRTQLEQRRLPSPRTSLSSRSSARLRSPRAGMGSRGSATERAAPGTPGRLSSPRSLGRLSSPRYSDVGEVAPPSQLLRVAGRVRSRSARESALQAQPPLRHLPRYPIPVPVHDTVAASDWAGTSRWLRDREATVALGHPPLLTTPGDLHVQHPHLVGNDLRGDHYDIGTIDPQGNTALHAAWAAGALPPADVYHHLLRACPAAVAHQNHLGTRNPQENRSRKFCEMGF